MLRHGDVAQPDLATGEVLVRTEHIGLNFADIYRRRGEYHIEQARPYINGYEASGIVVDGDKSLIGRPVLFVDVPFANAELVAVPQDKLIFLPEPVDLRLAATIGLQGLTADFLAHDFGMDNAGRKVFITGVSGGVGHLLAQMMIADGAMVHGSAGSPHKCRIALDMGVLEVVPSRETGWVGTAPFRAVFALSPGARPAGPGIVRPGHRRLPPG